MKAYTTIEESKQLIEAGLDPKTSDMYYSFMGEHIKEAKSEDFTIHVGTAYTIKDNHFSYRYGYVIPCWSLAALLELLPKSINAVNVYGEKIDCELRIHPLDQNAVYYIEPDGTPFYFHKGEFLFNNIVETLKWVYSIKI